MRWILTLFVAAVLAGPVARLTTTVWNDDGATATLRVV